MAEFPLLCVCVCVYGAYYSSSVGWLVHGVRSACIYCCSFIRVELTLFPCALFPSIFFMVPTAVTDTSSSLVLLVVLLAYSLILSHYMKCTEYIPIHQLECFYAFYFYFLLHTDAKKSKSLMRSLSFMCIEIERKKKHRNRVRYIKIFMSEQRPRKISVFAKSL